MDADVVVIGAGAAGLAAARALAARSLRVIVVEARDRTGGRVFSVPSSRSVVAAELGGEFIHGHAPETTALLREAGAAAVDLGDEAWTSDEGGDLRRDDRDRLMSGGLFHAARELVPDESVDRYLRRFENDPSLKETVVAARAFVEGFEAADPAIASARAIGDEWDSGVDLTTARPFGGYPPVFELLRRACEAGGVQTLLSTVVRRIAWRRGGVQVETESGGKSRTVRARAAIVTLPAGVLRHAGDQSAVTFDPDLPVGKRKALASVEMGHVVKVALRFRTAFWERIRDGRYRDAAFFRRPGGPFVVYWTQVPVRSELIVAWAGGPKATALRGSQTELIESALDGFGAIFGEPALAREEFEGGDMHDWNGDPFARGAYSYVAVGGGNAREVLSEAVDGTLFFAGEATSTDGQGGTVNGALETGERAAREAAISLGIGGDL